IMLENLFIPHLEVTFDPKSHPQLHILLIKVVVCDLVDNESNLKGEPQSIWLHQLKGQMTSILYMLIMHIIDMKTSILSRSQLGVPTKDKVLPNTSQVKFTKTEVEDHHRISSISNQTKSVTACNDILNSRTSNVNAVCATCRRCVFNSNHDACVSKFLNDVNARTKKPKSIEYIWGL
ncbi:hypothetical protein Tco_0658742, partial [Tanacetum coccineum]